MRVLKHKETRDLLMQDSCLSPKPMDLWILTKRTLRLDVERLWTSVILCAICPSNSLVLGYAWDASLVCQESVLGSITWLC